MTKISKTEIEKCIFIVRKQKVMLQLNEKEADFLRSQFVTSSPKHGGRRTSPYVFTEHGALMLANVINSEIAVEASIQVTRSFVQLREFVISHAELSKKLFELEKKYESKAPPLKYSYI